MYVHLYYLFYLYVMLLRGDEMKYYGFCKIFKLFCVCVFVITPLSSTIYSIYGCVAKYMHNI